MLTDEEHMNRIGEIRAEASPQRGMKPAVPLSAKVAVMVGLDTLHFLRDQLTYAQVEDLLTSVAALYPKTHSQCMRHALYTD